MNRYARQITLEEIGRAGQGKLSQSSILVIGAGGLGCPALQYLTAAGVGHIGIADFDAVEESNLQRQILFSHDQIGQNKARAAKEKLRALNPTVKITTYEQGLNNQNVETLYTNFDIIIDGTDNFDTKYLINDAGVKFGKPIIFGAINKFEGHVSVFDAQSGPCYRCLYPEKPQEHIPNCAEAGVIGAVADIVGTMQAMEAIKLIIAHHNFKPLIGKFLTINAATMQTRTLNILKDKQCPTCSKPAQDIILPTLKSISCEAQNMNTITAQQAQDKLHNDDIILIDVREQEEWDAGHIEGAQLHPLSAMMDGNIPDLPKDKTLLIYCRSGKRSQSAIQILSAKGYQDMINMIDGYLGWEALS